MKKRNIGFALAAVALLGLWYLFRPELLFVKTTVNEELPGMGMDSASGDGNSPATLLSGAFHSVAHETEGSATLLALPDGKRILRLTNFQTSNGPDVRVYLVAAEDAADNETVTRAGFIELGKLKGTEGDQNYEVPENVDIDTYRAATIWCARFGVNFATAPLMPAMNEPVPLYTGAFHGVAHETRGLATIYQLPGGKRVLRLTDFETSNGPDVQVYLGMAPDADDNETVTEAGFVGLGSLKGTTGDQNYDLPEDLDLSQYRSVTIWCRRFGVNFATAPLAPRAS